MTGSANDGNGPGGPAPDKVCSLDEAVGHVRAGDAVHIVTNHTRWTAAARHLVRHWWGRDPGFTLVMLSLSSLGTLFFRGGLVDKVVTGYSGDVFPSFSPNPRFSGPYLRGEVEVEHWSFLTFLQRLEAAARGLPAVTTGSLAGSSMADNPGYTQVDTPFGRVGLLEAYAPDIALLHAPLGDRQGNLAFQPPGLEGVWGALAARRGVVATVDRVVDDIRPWSHLVQVPAHRVLALAETPMGAHPGGLFARDLPVDPYGEDLEFWSEARTASHGDDFDAWIEEWVLGPASQQEYLERLGDRRIAGLRRRAEPDSWRDDEAAHPSDLAAAPVPWEVAAVHGARYLVERVLALDADAVLAGAGVANLAAWLAVDLAHGEGSPVVLAAELGLWDYRPTPADPFIFNHRSFPTAVMLGDAEQVLGGLVSGPGTSLLACLGAAQIDRHGNINSTVIGDSVFLVGSGGGNDVASSADEVVVMSTLTRRRAVAEVPYVTSPGLRVRAFVTDLALFERDASGELALTAVASGPGSVAERVAHVRDLCPWDLHVADDVAELDPPEAGHIERLRRWDPEGRFLRPSA
ncbi:MAG: CoA-transferase [Acidimicrobiales bacterium]|jgi:acyl CoA:acetate/3-ketoacid CoA transferase alpha subunit